MEREIMIKSHAFTAFLALGTLAALPGCANWNGMGSSSSNGSGYAAAPAPELSSDTVKQVQTALQQQGYYKGTIDGLWGPETQGSLKSFQQAKGLTPDGQLGPQTMAALNLSNANTASTTQPPANSATSSTSQPASNGSTAATQPSNTGSTSSTQPMNNGATSSNQPMMSNGMPASQSTASTTAPQPTTTNP
jgi:peptidoglycan hydrolase-like protein with peptidoglycan-binding domain